MNPEPPGTLAPPVAPPEAQQGRSDLGTRVATALVAAPLGIGAAYLGGGQFAHQQISMNPVFAEVCPSSGSLCKAWNSAHARSAWPVSSLRPAV